MDDSTHADLARAIALAAAAHAGQIDKSGKPYILHPIRVMQRLDKQSLSAQIVAVLHDVVEDTWMTLDLLRQTGFTHTVIDAVDAMTRRDDENYFDYINRCKRDPIAAVVKLADLDDNSDPVRSFAGQHLRLERYERARDMIMQHLNGR